MSEIYAVDTNLWSENALEEVVATAQICGKTLKVGLPPNGMKEAPWKPNDGCVVATSSRFVCGAIHACRLLAYTNGIEVDDESLEWLDAELIPALRNLENVFNGPQNIKIAPSVVPGLDDAFSVILTAMIPAPESIEQSQARIAVAKLLQVAEKMIAKKERCIFTALAGIECRQALKAFPVGTFPKLESNVQIIDTSALKVLGRKAVGQEPENGQLISSYIEQIIEIAIETAFPGLHWPDAKVMRCVNEKFGDFQCNAPMSIFKAIKGKSKSIASPHGVGEAIAQAIPKNNIIASVTVAPTGFVNMFLRDNFLAAEITKLSTFMTVVPPDVQRAFGGIKKVLVDFSSPNIAKEMHVGHLRSTIIGDTISRVLEFCGHDVLRVNHVGDWGTQFGMLIKHLAEQYPDFERNPPDLTDLTAFYKAAKARFDQDATFADDARATVVKLQAGDDQCRRVWQLLCDISRKEFDKVYARLDIQLEEFGESFYNAMIPNAIQLLENSALVSYDQGAAIVHLEGHSYPLIVRKKDGGFGYDSTDMAALHYRLFDLERDWLVYVTDLGQAEHFHMCFEAATNAGWVQKDKHKLRHVGFGVVQGDDGKRFKTRSGDTVRLVDLLDAAVDRMRESLLERVKAGKCPLSSDEVQQAAAIIGYGAVKYFDLHQHPETNYIFSYDKMLSTSGNTAVYLLFAYARLASIIRKAKDEHHTDIVATLLNNQQPTPLNLQHAKERALAFELTQFSDVVVTVATDYIPARLCDYLYKLATKLTEFVTECKVLGDPRQYHRLLLCHATGIIMRQCFALLGIKPLDRI
uniref:arginine--tRNA ligase n=1 Tax=Aureoumbra lagunensis TaxID=44058 RepID=A0A7S3NN71_9STRA